MPPRKTTDFGALFNALVEDLKIQVAASVDRTLGDIHRRLRHLERRLEHLDPKGVVDEADTERPRLCVLCDRPPVARGLCSPHYQQLRYRERKGKPRRSNQRPRPSANASFSNEMRTASTHETPKRH